MIYGYLVLIVGGMLIGGSWSFWRQRKPLWSSILLAVLGIVCIIVAFWRIRQG